MTLPSFITLPYALEREPPPFEPNAIKYPESLVRYWLNTFTTAGDKVFDPFVGLGTTLFVAEAMKRNPYGVEADTQRHQWVAGQMEHWMQVVCGDSAHVADFGFPKMDFCMTSPPFMPITHQWNPLYGGDPKKAGYAAYLKRLQFIFKQVARVMKKRSHLVVQVDNIGGRVFTPLVRDMSLAIAQSFRLQSEVVVAWENKGEDDLPAYRHTHCLVFRGV